MARQFFIESALITAIKTCPLILLHLTYVCFCYLSFYIYILYIYGNFLVHLFVGSYFVGYVAFVLSCSLQSFSMLLIHCFTSGRRSITWLTQRQTALHTHFPTYCMSNLEQPVKEICMSLDCGRKPQHSEESHACTWRTCKHAIMPQIHIYALIIHSPLFYVVLLSHFTSSSVIIYFSKELGAASVFERCYRNIFFSSQLLAVFTFSSHLSSTTAFTSPLVHFFLELKCLWFFAPLP